MKQIRQAWETNSSSSHSLVLENTPGMPVDATHFGAVEDNILRVIFQETCFSWQWDVWDAHYMGEDGKFSMYIDAVEQKFAKTSTAPYNQRQDWDISLIYSTIIRNKNETRKERNSY